MSKVIPPWLLPKETPDSLPELRPEDALLWDYARRYTGELGWSLCLLRPNSKLPMIQAWNDPLRVINTPEKAYLAICQNPGSGFGAVHNYSQTGTGDVDHTDWTRLAFAEFGLDYDTIFGAYPRIRSRMGKDKIVFRMPADWNGPSKIKLTWPDDSGECDARGNPKLITVFELRAGANQDVLPPSIHPDTQQPYEWLKAPWEFPQGIPDVPLELLTIWTEWEAKFRKQFEQACPWLPQAEMALPPPMVTRQVGAQHNNLIGKFNERFNCVALLERNGYLSKGKRWLSPSSSTNVPGVVVLGDRVYSHHASDALSDNHAHDAFSLFTILEHHGDLKNALKEAARELGLSFGNTVKSASESDISSFIEAAKAGKFERARKKPEAEKPSEMAAFPEYLLTVPGLVGEIAGFINRTALFPQPVLALAASLSFCGALMGRKVCSETNLRTNIYTIGVAPSGSGKEHARKAIKQLVVAANAEWFVGAEKLASDQGLFALLHQSPACIALMDEFGRTLRVMNNDRAPPHLAQLLTTIMELTGSADSYIMEKRRAEHNSRNQPLSIHFPNFCIYATTVPGRLYQGLTPDEVTDGFLPRFLVFESNTPDPDEQELTHGPIPLDLLTKIEYWAKKTIEVQGEGNMTFQPQMISMDNKAKALMKEKAQLWKQKKIDARGQNLDALWARAYEHSMRLALIRSAGIGDVMTEEDVGWGCEVAGFLLQRMADQALANLATNEHEGHVQKVSAYIKAEKYCTLEQLARRFRWLKQKERDGILAGLMDEGLVDVINLKTGGRPRSNIAWIG